MRNFREIENAKFRDKMRKFREKNMRKFREKKENYAKKNTKVLAKITLPHSDG